MTRPGKPRRLTPEEVTLWRAVAETVERRVGSVLPELPPPPPPARDPGSLPPQTAAAVPSRALEKAIRRRSPPPLADLDRRTRTRITRGKVGIDRAIDLHGLSQADAHAALRRFLFAAHAADLRLVLVVTGKGERGRTVADASRSTGVLKRMVPHWLHDLDLRPIVLGFEAAGAPHGGAGALYIRLRRRKAAT